MNKKHAHYESDDDFPKPMMNVMYIFMYVCECIFICQAFGERCEYAFIKVEELKS